MLFVYILLAVILLLMICTIIYFACSPMPVVKLLRKNMGGDNISLPDDCGNLSDGVIIHRNLIYHSQYAQNTYDLFVPKNTENPPLILWIHGGAFVAGDKSGTENWGMMLASKGYAVASMNYCWSPEASYPVQIKQIAEALSAIMNDETSREFDFRNIFIAGDSAGAYMAAQFVACHTNKDLADALGVVSPLKNDALRGALLYCGPYDVKKFLQIKNRKLRLFVSRIGWSFFGRKNWKKSPLVSTVTPLDFVTGKFAPCYITDGNSWSFESHGRALGKKLRENGVYVKERYFPKEEYGEVSHEYQMRLDTANGMLCFNDTLDFLSKLLFID